MIKKAAVFAEQAHRGMFRKGTRIPYIVHPMEVAVIVSAFTNDEEMIAAALLHDVVEDAHVTGEELRARFGSRVESLVMAESEDKTKTWKERKSATVEHLKAADISLKILTLGDKLSNMRSTAREYLIIRDKVWERFNEKDKRQHAWYYRSMAQAMKELEGHIYYQEYVGLCNFVFGDE